MSKKLTITVEEEVLAEGYRAMAADEEYECEAQEWVESLTGDVADDPE